MCQFKSAIVLRNKVVLAPDGNESHSDLLNNLGIEDSRMNAMKKFVRVELIPKDGNRSSDVSTWRYRVDQDIVPDWYEEDKGRYEWEIREKVKDWLDSKFVRVCNHLWTEIKREDGTYYFMYGVLKTSMFGKNNNFGESYIRDDLSKSELLHSLKNKFGDRLLSIKTDLTSMDGFKDYGVVEGDFLSVPTFDLFRECGEKLPLIDDIYWLATPNQTKSRRDTSYVQVVYSRGCVDCNDCGCSRGVRPFFVLKNLQS